MSTSNDLNHPFDAYDDQNQICYVQCGYCSSLLLVRVPSSRLAAFVTVRCGHCTTVVGVNMMKAPAAVPPLHLYSSQSPFSKHESKREDLHEEEVDQLSPSPVVTSVYEEKEDGEEDDDNIISEVNQVIKPPPTKRHRAASLYNCFMRDEIHRLKKINPELTHKQAFSSAAKNWAHFPSNKHNMGESQGQEKSNF